MWPSERFGVAPMMYIIMFKTNSLSQFLLIGGSGVAKLTFYHNILQFFLINFIQLVNYNFKYALQISC